MRLGGHRCPLLSCFNALHIGLAWMLHPKRRLNRRETINTIAKIYSFAFVPRFTSKRTALVSLHLLT